jgi:hypothetical protein
MLKNVPDNLYRILFSRMILDGIAEFNFFAGKFSHFSAILKAHYSFTSFSTAKRAHFQKKKYYNIKVSFTNTI